MSPNTNAVSLRTSNRNFENRSGTKSARVYLVSPATAAVAALTGRVVDPRALEELKYPSSRLPKSFDTDDSMFVLPATSGEAADDYGLASAHRVEKKPADIAIVKGPNIGDVPANDPLPERLAGVVTIKVEDKVTTDHIMPAGPRLKFRSNAEKYSSFVFENVDPDFRNRAVRYRDEGKHNIIVAGASYGQGSSREHAALCPMYLGVKAVLAKSIERIHLANLVNFGIVPLTFASASDYQAVDPGDELTLDGFRDAVTAGQGVLRNETKGADIKVKVGVSDRQKETLLAGGLLNQVSPDRA
jgi:aconitate hydratase